MFVRDVFGYLVVYLKHTIKIIVATIVLHTVLLLYGSCYGSIVQQQP